MNDNINEAYSFWTSKEVFFKEEILLWFKDNIELIQKCIEFDKVNNSRFSLLNNNFKSYENRCENHISSLYKDLYDFFLKVDEIELKSKTILEHYNLIKNDKIRLLTFIKENMLFVFGDIEAWNVCYMATSFYEIPNNTNHLYINIHTLRKNINIYNSACKFTIELYKLFYELIDDKNLEPEISILIDDFNKSQLDII